VDCSQVIAAVKYTTKFCCDRHQNGFNLQDFVPGTIFTGKDDKVPAEKKKRAVYRPVKDRVALEESIHTWRRHVHANDSVRMVMPARWIIDDGQIKTLAATLPSALSCPETITRILGKPSEWSKQYAHSLFNVIQKYEVISPSIRKRRSPTRSPSPSGVENEGRATRPRLVIKLPGRAVLVDKSLNTL
jgi:hypothetical protein